MGWHSLGGGLIGCRCLKLLHAVASHYDPETRTSDMTGRTRTHRMRLDSRASPAEHKGPRGCMPCKAGRSPLQGHSTNARRVALRLAFFFHSTSPLLSNTPACAPCHEKKLQQRRDERVAHLPIEDITRRTECTCRLRKRRVNRGPISCSLAATGSLPTTLLAFSSKM